MRVQPQVVLRKVLQSWLKDPTTGLAPYFEVNRNAAMFAKDRRWHIWLCRNWYGSYSPMWAMAQIEDDRIVIDDYLKTEILAADPQFFKKVLAFLKARKLAYQDRQLDIPINEVERYK